MKEEIKAILGKYKVIGDTTYGLGYVEAEQLANELVAKFVEKVEGLEAPECKDDSCEYIHEGYFKATEDMINLLKG